MRSSVDLHIELLSRGVAHEFFRVEHRARTAEEAAHAMDVDPGGFATATVLASPYGAVLVVTSLTDTADPIAVARVTGLTGLEPAPPMVASRLTGFPAGWEPPVSLAPDVQTVIDPALMEYPVIYGPAGEPGLLVGIRTDDLLAAGALVAPVAAPVASMT